VPTFCRGWGHLPFDQSCCDITAHAVEALALWRDYILSKDFVVFDDAFMKRLDTALFRMTGFLEAEQRDGAWLPLWFGHQQSQQKLNHVIGTARVLSGLHALRNSSFAGDDTFGERLDSMIERGEARLVKDQKQDGGWSAGVDSTLEESALVVAALSAGETESRAAMQRGAQWLEDMILNNEIIPAPLGLYFSVLWYDEALYPLIWSAAAFQAVLHQGVSQSDSGVLIYE
jgi:squalene-hopene/tetraprenyl-beta-curcumene cyclase